MKKLAVPIFVVLASIGFAVALWLIFIDAPLQVSSGPARGSSLFFNQKIFFFHVAHAYAILRHNGVKLGKMDYIGVGLPLLDL